MQPFLSKFSSSFGGTTERRHKVLFLTAATLGLCAGLMRSAFAIALVAVLISLTFVVASLVSSGPWAFGALLAAILGYNFGLISFFAGMLLATRLREA